MKKFFFAACALLLAVPALRAQSETEIRAAKSLARSYGYSNEEIEQAMNKNAGMANQTQVQNNGVVNGQVVPYGQPNVVTGTAGTVMMTPVSNVMVGMEDIPSPTTIAPVGGHKAPYSDVYGHDFFISDGLALIPSVNAPVPASYKLGPGDEISIDIWGNSNANYTRVISNDGTITIQGIGPVTVSGMTVTEAERTMKSRLSKLHSSLNGGGAKIQLTVNKIRGVTVYVLGEVFTPGVYTLPSLSSIPTAIFMAGGILKHGSVRKINLYRNSELAGTFDLYAYIFKGQYDTSIRLQDGDIISVGSISQLAKVGGGLNRNELKYEMTEGETVADLIKYAGGFSTDAYRDIVHLDRQNGPLGTAYDIKAEEFDSFGICAGDSLYVNVNQPKLTNRVFAAGAVMHPGPYAISDKVSNVRQLIEAAGGLQEGSYSNRGYVLRRDADMKPVSLSFNLERIMNGLDNIDLVRDDSVRVFSVIELQDSTFVTVKGEVNLPGDFEFREGMTIGDVILMAGGLADGGDLSNVEVASRGRDSLSAYVRRFNLKERPEDNAVILNPFDLIFVRKNVNYRPLPTVTVSGEVKYPGTYAIEKSVVRISDIIARTEGFTDEAYTKGAKLKRKLTKDEFAKLKAFAAMDSTFQLAPQPTAAAVPGSVAGSVPTVQMTPETPEDSLKIAQIKAEEESQTKTYDIGINIEEAVKHPGSYADIILKEGDEIVVPQMNNTVKVSGGVYFPNTVAFNPSSSWKDYVSNAGGFTKNARKRKTYAIYMDGTSAVHGSSKFRMEPGMELVVPVVPDSDSKKVSIAEVASIISSMSSMAYMAAILINLFK
ncbi:MAG: SLBB domain-containing protein [Bacteroidales bacterium]|nr:SLBB domain-containing protein [Bacteroidales bacterium]